MQSKWSLFMRGTQQKNENRVYSNHMNSPRLIVGQLQIEHPLASYLNSFFIGKNTLPVVFGKDNPANPLPNEGAFVLEITPESIRIEGNKANALSSLLSLIQKEEGQTYLPIVHLADAPRFPWRGVLLDEARHFMGKAFVKRLLDNMFKLRLNKFHWHLSDDQGFRLLLPDFPRLEKATRRAYTLEGFVSGKKTRVEGNYGFAYSPEDIREIVDYASVRGIEIIPEIDMPGHLSAILSCYPEYTCSKKPFEVPGYFGVLDHTLCLGNPEARAFMLSLIDEVAYLFKAKHIHIGFDEITTQPMKECPQCQKRIQELKLSNEKELIADFRKEVKEHLKTRGIIPLVWNDGLNEKDEGTIAEVWETVKPGNKRRAIHAINNGQKALISPFFLTYASNPYCLMPLKKTFEFDPVLRGIKKPGNVLGSEVCYWSEYYRGEAKFAFEFDARALVLSATLWGEKKGTYANFMKDLQEKECFVFAQNTLGKPKLFNPSFFKRPSSFVRYTRDVNSEFKKR
jgi:hexosaminidase